MGRLPPGEALFLAYRMQPSHCVLTLWRPPTLMTSSKRDYLLKAAPPSTMTVKLRATTCEFEFGGGNNSVHILFYLSVYLSIYLSTYLSNLHESICLLTHPSVCPFFIYLFFYFCKWSRTRGDSAHPQGTIDSVWRHFRLSQLKRGNGCSRHLGDGDQGSCKHPMRRRTPPSLQSHVTLNISSSQVEKLH